MGASVAGMISTYVTPFLVEEYGYKGSPCLNSERPICVFFLFCTRFAELDEFSENQSSMTEGY